MTKKSKPKPTPKRKPAKPAASASGQIDRELAAACLRKRRAGEKPSREEVRALQRIERAQEEARRWEYYESIPKRHYLQLAGTPDRPRPSKVVNEQANRYGAPLAGKTVNLRKIFKWLHDFLAENRWKLAAGESDDAVMAAGGDSVWLERYREEKTLLARLERQTKERQLLPRDEVHDGLARVASILRGVGEVLQRDFGPDAHQLLEDGLNDAQREIDRIFQNGQGEEESDSQTNNPEPAKPGGTHRRRKARPKKRLKP